MSDLKRTPNFTAREEEVLLQLVKKYKHILECKTTDGIQNRKKIDTWNIVENEFNRNSSGIVHRNGQVLKNKYINIKKRVQKKMANQKAGVKGTGGGPYLKVNFDESDTTICEILGEKRLGLQRSQYDDNANVQEQYISRPSTSTSSDILTTFLDDIEVSAEQAVVEEEVDSPYPQAYNDIFEDTVLLKKEHTKGNDSILHLMSEESIPPMVDDPTLEQESDKGHKWSGNTTPLLRTKKKECLVQKDMESQGPSAKKQKLNDQMSLWASGKAGLAKLQEKTFIEHSTLKLQLMKEESSAKMAREERLARLQEKEVQLRIDILSLQKSKLENS